MPVLADVLLTMRYEGQKSFDFGREKWIDGQTIRLFWGKPVCGPVAAASGMTLYWQTPWRTPRILSKLLTIF